MDKVRCDLASRPHDQDQTCVNPRSVKEEPKVNEEETRESFIKSVVEYLSTPGHPQRLECLVDLVNERAFGWGVDNIRANILSYLNHNPRNFCKDGIDRFRKFLEPEPEMKVYFNSAEYLVKRQGKQIWVKHSEQPFTSTSIFGQALLKALQDNG